ncbi:hypothetical protein SKAU_G00065290 [Synaphobranchus kaupii]|uniref:Uncharacterized protein n=1 Tax=Synaphobranchus kaupii TaxID=118154 RepID=A0A9Q1G5N4_SYNKA|nr:hypothetical protein SKAU_G00065290 [Synaphobranchus kaupii]
MKHARSLLRCESWRERLDEIKVAPVYAAWSAEDATLTLQYLHSGRAGVTLADWIAGEVRDAGVSLALSDQIPPFCLGRQVHGGSVTALVYGQAAQIASDESTAQQPEDFFPPTIHSRAFRRDFLPKRTARAPCLWRAPQCDRPVGSDAVGKWLDCTANKSLPVPISPPAHPERSKRAKACSVPRSLRPAGPPPQHARFPKPDNILQPGRKFTMCAGSGPRDSMYCEC